MMIVTVSLTLTIMIIITLTVTIIIDYNDKYYVKYSENYIHVYYAKYNNSDNYNANHVPFILSACRLFKMSSSLKSGF